MPAPDVHRPTDPKSSRDSRPLIGHVNLMTDTLISNASASDLRAIVRSLLATGPPSTSSAFCAVARTRFAQSHSPKSLPSPSSLFSSSPYTHLASPTPLFYETLSRARALFGAGMGIESLELLTCVVRATLGRVWSEDGAMADALCTLDGDIAQGIQACKEELAAGLVKDVAVARKALEALRTAMKECKREVQTWDGEFPFEKGAANADCWMP